MLVISLVTRGSPAELTGGHLYHRRMADAAPARGVRIEFISATMFHNPLRRTRGVVLVDSLAAWTVTPWLFARPHPDPIAAIVHQPPGGLDQGSFRTALQGRLDRALYRRCALLIVASTALADELAAEHGLVPDRIRVIEPGSDLPTGPSPGRDLRHGRRVALLSVANWLPNKGVLELLDAVAALPDGYVTLHLAGRDDVDAAYGGRVRARLRSSDLSTRVVVHGIVPRDEIGGLYANADAFALASYRETYGTVYGEALAAGLPTVGWRSGNLPHLIEDGREGRLLEPGDIHGLTAALERLAIDDDWRDQLGAAAKRRGKRLPTWDDAADRFFGAMTQLAPRRQ